jgi:hypothetical protein
MSTRPSVPPTLCLYITGHFLQMHGERLLRVKGLLDGGRGAAGGDPARLGKSAGRRRS